MRPVHLRFTWVTAVMTGVLACLTLSLSQARSIRVDDEGSGWSVVASSILQKLPPGLGFPTGLKIGVLGAKPTTVDQFAGPTAPSTVRAGFTIVKGRAVPAALAVTTDTLGVSYDAQFPLWLPPPLPVVCASSPLLSFYACPSNPVAGIKIEWGVPAQEQITFLKLDSPKGVQLYDSGDYNCSPQGYNNLGQACHYDNVGLADGSWEIEFNCVPAQPAVGGLPAVPGGCPQGASLQWRGRLYVASADVLDLPSSTSPDQGPALNEFVYNAGRLWAPPGWKSYAVTQTTLSGPQQCAFVAGTPLSFGAQVFAYSEGTPTGKVTLVDGITTLATDVLYRGSAKFVTSLGSGTHSLTLNYQGDSLNAPSQSAVDVLVSQDQAGATTTSCP
jgi:hypothetical protein